jgi:fatty-acid desaturase
VGLPVAETPLRRGRYDVGLMLPFLLLHASVLLVFIVPFHASLVAWLAGTYFLRMFGVTAGYHRYFSHRAYKLNRFWQFVMAILAQTSAQKGVLCWAAHHRDHHLHSDRATDDVCFCERRVKNTRRAEISLQIRSYFKNAAFAFDLFEIFFARYVRHVFAENHDARIALHFFVQTAVDQINHRSCIAGKFRAVFGVEIF